MNEERTEQVKIGLLALIAILVIYQTATDNSGNSGSNRADGQNTEIGVPNIPVNTIVPPAPTNIPPNPSPVPSTPGTSMEFDEPNADLGGVKRRDESSHSFKVTNTGTTPLSFGNVNTDPGLILVSRPNQPVAPGETSEIVVKLAPDVELGSIEKTVHLASNTEPAHYHLTLKAVVTE
ncbi:MAG: hypothetical protein COB85_06205 [Bacteroidetes bacterium]|nr:MAG: hypothetical protein COB85_06205 [Bacteroidota bacterium]